MRKIIHLPEEEIEFILISNNAITSVYNEYVLEIKQSIFQNLETFFRTMRREKDDFNFLLKVSNCNFETYDIPPGKGELFVNNNSIKNLIDASGSIDFITTKSRVKTNNIVSKKRTGASAGVSRLDDKSFCNTILGFRANWDHKPNIEHKNQRNI